MHAEARDSAHAITAERNFSLMTNKPVWANPIEAAAWQEKHCARCFQPDEARKRITGEGDGCPIWITGLTNKLPHQWTRRRDAVMGDTYRCSAFLPKPPVSRRASAPAEMEPMLEVEPTERSLVPVEGWPQYRKKLKKGEGEHQ